MEWWLQHPKVSSLPSPSLVTIVDWFVFFFWNGLIPYFNGIIFIPIFCLATIVRQDFLLNFVLEKKSVSEPLIGACWSRGNVWGLGKLAHKSMDRHGYVFSQQNYDIPYCLTLCGGVLFDESPPFIGRKNAIAVFVWISWLCEQGAGHPVHINEKSRYFIIIFF